MEDDTAPAAEERRLATLRALLVLDSAPEPLFDAIVRLASEVCGTPIALVSLVDATRQWFKANVGLPGVAETPREVAFCDHAIGSDAVLEVPDAARDPRFRANPLVTGEPDIRFYAGAPLVLEDGERVGTLCVIDRQPRRLDAQQARLLRGLAALASQALAMRRDLVGRALAARSDYERALAASEAHHRAIVEEQTELVALSRADRKLVYVNPAYARHFGAEPADLIGTCLLDLVEPAHRAEVDARLDAALCAGERVLGENRTRARDGGERWVEWTNRSTTDANGERLLLSVGRDVTDRKRTEEALRASRALLARTERVAGVGGWELDLASGAIVLSDETCRIHDLPAGHAPTLEEAFGYYAPAARPAIEQAVRHGMVYGEPWDLELPFVTARGRRLWVRAIGEVEFGPAATPLRLTGALQDITERKRLERELAGQHELIRVTLHSIADAVITTDADGRVRYMNPAAERLAGWSAVDAAGRPIEDVLSLLDETTREPVASPIGRCLAEDRAVAPTGDMLLVTRHGTERGIEDTAAPIRGTDGDVLGAVLVFRDVTAQRRQAHEMTWRATHDVLTGLVNRAEFESRLARLLGQTRHDGGRHALMAIDLDRFKLVNDACGHAAGDRLLRQVSALLKQCVRSLDTVARLGGDEFGILLAQCTVEQARRVAQQVCDRVEAFDFVHDGQRFGIGASVGLVPLDARWPSPDSAQQAADGACYAAKRAGRNRVHVGDAGLSPQVETGWAARLERALDDGRFELQAVRIEPLARAAARGGVHCRVQLGLREADGTLLPTAEFMPAAERFDLASRLDRWLVEAATRLAAGDERGAALVLVPLAAQSVADRALHRGLAETIAPLGSRAKALCLEMSEAAVLDHPAEATELAAAVRAAGARIALGGLGAGTSFGMLRTLAPDLLRLDGAALRGVADDALDRIAVRCWRDAAAVVGALTVADGVERRPLAALRELGIDYTIRRAGPPDALLREPERAVEPA